MSSRVPPTPKDRANLFLELWLDYIQICEHIGSSHYSVTINLNSLERKTSNKENAHLLVKISFLRKFYTASDQVYLRDVITDLVSLADEDAETVDFLNKVTEHLDSEADNYFGIDISKTGDSDQLTTATIEAWVRDLVYGRSLHADWDKYARNEQREDYPFKAIGAWVNRMQVHCDGLYDFIINHPNKFSGVLVDPLPSRTGGFMTMEESIEWLRRNR